MEFIILGLIAVVIAWLAVLTFKIRKLVQYHGLILGNLKDVDMAKAVSGYIRRSEALEGAFAAMEKRLDHTGMKVAECFQKVGFVKYDAFGDVGGELSSSLAILTANGNGFVITSINGRSDSRVYVKTVENRKSLSPLSEEESKAIASAMKGSVN